jgi:hypothetical protein
MARKSLTDDFGDNLLKRKAIFTPARPQPGA